MIWINGQLGDSGNISVLDHGFTVGDGVFETIKSVDGRAFALTRHLDRLESSARGMLMPAPPRDEVIAGVEQLLQASRYPVGRLRVTWTTGAGGAGSHRAEQLSPTLVISHHPAAAWAENARVAVAAWPRNERSPLGQLKTISYAENVLALAHAERAGAEESLFFNLADNLCEGTGSNVIARIRGEWVTPPISAGVLAGVTRALAIEWCGVKEADVSRTDFLDASEVVLSSTTRDLQAVGWVDGRAIAGTSSEAVKKLIATFAECATRKIDP